MQLLEIECPECEHQDAVPWNTLAEGDAGVYVCGSCATAFEIVVTFERINVTSYGDN